MSDLSFAGAVACTLMLLIRWCFYLFVTHNYIVSRSIDLLPGCATYIQLSLLSTHQAGDHDVVICKVMATGVWNEEKKSVVLAEGPVKPLDPTIALYTAQLSKEGFL